MADPTVEAVLTAIHHDPARAWTLDALAAVAHVSRATLTRRFSELVGQAPTTYLMGWRMDLAAQRLRETDQRTADIARMVGYTSEFAFSRAFARAFVVSHPHPPGREHTRPDVGFARGATSGDRRTRQAAVAALDVVRARGQSA